MRCDGGKGLGRFPHPIQTGGLLCYAPRELKRGASTSVNALGHNFAIFRDQTGQTHILDAYCAHLGANLGVGGAVSDSFSHWNECML